MGNMQYHVIRPVLANPKCSVLWENSPAGSPDGATKVRSHRRKGTGTGSGLSSLTVPITSIWTVPHLASVSWADNMAETLPDNITPIRTLLTVPSNPALRDFSALCSAASAHPWRTVRRRNQRLLPWCCERQPFPTSVAKRPPASALCAPVQAVLPVHVPPPAPTPIAVTIPPLRTLPLALADILSFSSAIGPPPVLVLPRPMPLPWDPYKFIPGYTPLLAHSLPGETAYGLVQSGLALVCAHEYPWIAVALATSQI
ncbi:hypothetical protein B0H14DRAFT_2589246 [Mycena olivaceomarginata]|nr:hypothetical protein B0H14DRAFT_2589246 [Mycena olivaceomarginata]